MRAPGRLEEFKREVAARRGPAEAELDGTPESLIGVWRWFVKHAGDWDGQLPPWYEPDPPELARQRLRPQVLHDADGLAHYLAQVFKQEMPDLEWGIYKADKRLRDVDQNKPVLKNQHDIEVVGVAYVKALKIHNERKDRKPDALLRTFHAWLAPTSAI